MNKILLTVNTTLLSLGLCHAQIITDSGYRTIEYIKADGTIQDGSTLNTLIMAGIIGRKMRTVTRLLEVSGEDPH